MKALVQWFLFNGGYAVAGLVLSWIVGYVAFHFVKVWIDKDITGKRKEGAQILANLADSITDEIVKANPNIPVLKLVDSLVDKFIQESGLKPENAQRAVNAALLRAGLLDVPPNTIELRK